jgi:hypothetical protein
LARAAVTVLALAAVVMPGLPAAAAQVSQATAHLGSGPQGGGLPVGPVKVSPLGHPGLCWMAWGNGSPVTLQSCDTTLQGEEWTFTTDGVLMNGNGYCLQNGGPAQSGPGLSGTDQSGTDQSGTDQSGTDQSGTDQSGTDQSGTDQLYLSFSGQCAAAASQNWTFSGATGSIMNSPAGVCAYVQGPLVSGAGLVGRRCRSAHSLGTWSQGVSDLTVSSPRRGAAIPAKPVPGRGTGTGAHRAFAAQVTVSNGPGAMTAYGASVSLRPPAGLTVTGLSGTGSLSGWDCAVRALRCGGSLAGDSAGTITIAGNVAGRQAAIAAGIAVRAAVTGTNQARHAALTAAVPVRVYTVAAAVAATASAGKPPGIATVGLIAAGLLLAMGAVLAFAGRRRRTPLTPAPAETSPDQ